MRLTVDVPKPIHQQIADEKDRTGLSKSFIVRRILRAYYGKKAKPPKKEVSHA